MAVATQHAELGQPVTDEALRARLDRTMRLLREVMQTLEATCPSDEHRDVYNRAVAYVVEYGLVLNPERIVRQDAAYQRWEADKREQEKPERWADGTEPRK